MTRVVLDAMPPMLMSIVRDVLDGDGTTEIVASGIAHGELDQVARATNPDAIVIGSGDGPLTGTALLAQLLRGGGHPVRIVALADRNRSALLHELRPHVTVIEELSPRALLEAIRGDLPRDREEGSGA